MSKRLCLSVAVGLLLLGVGGGFVLARLGGDQGEPVYQGKTLSLWLDDYFRSTYGPPYNRTARKKAEEAVRQIGTNGIPTLLRMIRAKDPPTVMLKLLDLVRKQSLVKIRYRYARDRHDLAYYAFQILGTNAACAVPELIRICAEPRYPASQQYAAQALGDIGPEAKAAIPVLLKTFNHTNAEVRFAAVTAVLPIGGDPNRGDPNILVPALKGMLKDPKPEVRFNAAAGLWSFGVRARTALPELLEALQDQDQSVKEEVENVLWSLAPEKVAKPLVVEDATPMVANDVTTEALSRPDPGRSDGRLWTLIPQGKPLRCVTYQAVTTPLYLYRGLTLNSTKDHFLGRFEVAGIPTNTSVEVAYIIDHGRVLLCARAYERKQFVELRRVENEAAK